MNNLVSNMLKRENAVVFFYFAICLIFSILAVKTSRLLLVIPIGIILFYYFVICNERNLFYLSLSTLILRPIIERYLTNIKVIFLGLDAIIIAGIAFLMVIKLAYDNKILRIFKELPINKYYIGFLLTLLISSIFFSRNNISFLRTWFSFVSIYIFCNFIAIYSNNNIVRYKRILISIILSSFYPLIAIFYQFKYSPVFRSDLSFRMGGITSGYDFSIFIGIIGVLVFTFFIFERKKIIKIALFSMLILIIISSLLSGSRIGFLGLLLSIFIFILFSKGLVKGIRYTILYSLILLIIFINFKNHFPDTIVRLKDAFVPSSFSISNSSSTMVSRFVMYKWILDKSISKWFLGYGLGSFEIISSEESMGSDAGTSFTLILFEGGFLALFFLAMMIIIPIKLGLSELKFIHTKKENFFLILLLIVSFFGLFASIGEVIYLTQVKGLCYWVIIAVSLSAVKNIKNEGYNGTKY